MVIFLGIIDFVYKGELDGCNVGSFMVKNDYLTFYHKCSVNLFIENIIYYMLNAYERMYKKISG